MKKSIAVLFLPSIFLPINGYADDALDLGGFRLALGMPKSEVQEIVADKGYKLEKIMGYSIHFGMFHGRIARNWLLL